MKPHYIILAASVLLAGAGERDNRASKQPAVGKAVRTAPDLRASPRPFRPVYRPPMLGAPRVTTASGTRGGSEAPLRLAVLAPDHVGLTTQAQPTLFWVQAGAETAVLELTLVVVGEPDVLLESRWPRGVRGRLQKLDLSRSPVRLLPGKEYKWSIAAVWDPERRSQDLVASGLIRRVEPDPELRRRLVGAGERARVALYAEAGIWYDALAGLQSLVEKDSEDPEVLAAATAWGLRTETGDRRPGVSE